MNPKSYMNMEQQDLMSIAGTFVPLCSLKPNYLKYLLLHHASVEYVCAGHKWVERGACDQRHAFLLSGQISLQFASGFREVVQAQDSLSPLVNEMPRPCDVVAETDCSVLVIDSECLDRILSWSQISEYLLSAISVKRELDEDVDWIKTVLNSNLFYKVPPVNAELVLGSMKAQLVERGDVIIRQGEVGNCCYFIKDGQATVFRHDEHQNVRHIADIGIGRCFGEDALVYETHRNASVEMLTDGVLMRLSKEDFKPLLLEPKVEEVDEEGIQRFQEMPVYIDVRTLAEYDEGHLSMSVNMPLNLLSIERRLLRNDVPYVIYCDTGRRSRSAAYLLGQLGVQAVSLLGGVLGAGMQYQLVHDSSYILKDGRVVKAVNQ